ncbi:MAG: hypothetical protein IJ565_01410 [Bacilli bacterium]|nr:hypothetical protein [Bacilli bacterium]
MKKRYLIATTTTLGKSGDLIDVNLKDGTTIPCIIADAKSSHDENWSTYGHTSKGQVNVVEWEVASAYYKDYGNPSSSNGYNLPWDSTSKVVSVDNKGSLL